MISLGRQDSPSHRLSSHVRPPSGPSTTRLPRLSRGLERTPLLAGRPWHSSPYLVTSLSPYFHFSKSFSCNTYGSPRKCCKQKTCGSAKPFKCNTYKKHGGRGCRTPSPTLPKSLPYNLFGRPPTTKPIRYNPLQKWVGGGVRSATRRWVQLSACLAPGLQRRPSFPPADGASVPGPEFPIRRADSRRNPARCARGPSCPAGFGSS